MHRKPVILSTLLVLPLLLATSATARKKTFSEETSVVVVEVPVNVIRDGEPLRGLRAEDFEVFDGRKRVDLVDFQEVDLVDYGPSAGSAQQVPIAARRHFLLLFDLSYSAPSSILKARRAARQTVLDGLHESDLAAVATYATNAGARLVLSFTSDRRQVELAMETLGAPNLLDLHPDPLRILLTDFQTAESFGGSAATNGSKGNFDALMQEHLQSIYRAEAASARGEQTDRITAMTRSLTDLAGLMSTVEGRKHVVYLSEGFDPSLLLGTTDQESIARTNLASARGRIWEVDAQERFGDTGAVNDLESMIEAFRRSDCAVQAVDIGGLRADNDLQARASGKDGLVAMARGSGGHFIENVNDLGDAFGQILDRTSVTYLLAFQPRKLELDGKYHKLKVELVGDDAGVELQHRPGYYAPLPYSERSAVARSLDKGAQILGGEAGGAIAVAATASPFRVEGQKAYVPVFVEVDGKTLMGSARQGTLGIEVYAYAMANDGAFRDYFSRQVGLDLTQATPALEQSGAKFFGHLDLDEGSYTVRILVRNVVTGASGLTEVNLEVPDWSNGQPTLTSPVLTEPMGRWLMIREDEAQQQERSVPYPFSSAGGPFFPSARMVVAADSPSSFWAAGYHLASEAEVSGRLTDVSGTREIPGLGAIERLSDPAGGKEVLTATVPAGLPAGTYRLEMTAEDRPSGSRVASAAVFEVVH